MTMMRTPAPAPRRGRRALMTSLLVTALVAALAWLTPTPPRAPDGAPVASTPFPWARTPEGATPDVAGAAASPADPAPAVAATPPARPAERPERPGAVFRADAQGRLVLDATTRLRTEALLALHPGEALHARTEAELADLPAAAAARARELMSQMQAYQAAQRINFPPSEAPLVPEEGLTQLAALQAMRATHFGAEAAQQMFGEDDAVTRRLLELMRDEQSTLLSMEQKAMRAQARYDIERGAVRP